MVDFSITKMFCEFSTETGEDDAATYILRIMNSYSRPILGMKASLNLDANYFNMENGSFEPLIEPWSLYATIRQKVKTCPMVISIESEKLLNINITHGMALVIKLIMTKINQTSDDWADEQVVRAVKQKMSIKKMATRQSESPLKAIAHHMIEQNQKQKEKEKRETQGFYFENNLGVPLKITLEDYNVWEEKQIDFSHKPEFKKESVIDFADFENDEGTYFRKLKTLREINKYVLKKSEKAELLKHYEDPLIRIDLYIPGMRPVRKIPIEVAGLSSYELHILQNEDEIVENEKFDFIVVVDISQMGAKKMVSFESQVIMTNHTYLEINIAHVLINVENDNAEEITETDILQAVEKSREQYEMVSSQQLTEFNKNFDYDDLKVFECIQPNEEYRVPLKWFLKDVAIYYRTQYFNDITYRILLPDIKKTRYYNTKLHSEENSKNSLPKYYFLRKFYEENVFFAMELK